MPRGPRGRRKAPLAQSVRFVPNSHDMAPPSQREGAISHQQMIERETLQHEDQQRSNGYGFPSHKFQSRTNFSRNSHLDRGQHFSQQSPPKRRNSPPRLSEPHLPPRGSSPLRNFATRPPGERDTFSQNELPPDRFSSPPRSGRQSPLLRRQSDFFRKGGGDQQQKRSPRLTSPPPMGGDLPPRRNRPDGRANINAGQRFSPPRRTDSFPRWRYDRMPEPSHRENPPPVGREYPSRDTSPFQQHEGGKKFAESPMAVSAGVKRRNPFQKSPEEGFLMTEYSPSMATPPSTSPSSPSLVTNRPTKKAKSSSQTEQQTQSTTDRVPIAEFEKISNELKRYEELHRLRNERRKDSYTHPQIPLSSKYGGHELTKTARRSVFPQSESEKLATGESFSSFRSAHLHTAPLENGHLAMLVNSLDNRILSSSHSQLKLTKFCIRCHNDLFLPEFLRTVGPADQAFLCSRCQRDRIFFPNEQSYY